MPARRCSLARGLRGDCSRPHVLSARTRPHARATEARSVASPTIVSTDQVEWFAAIGDIASGGSPAWPAEHAIFASRVIATRGLHDLRFPGPEEAGSRS